jgi:transposase
MTNVINLPRYNVIHSKEEAHDFHVSAETALPPLFCFACGSNNIVGGGRQEILIKDTPAFGKRVGIYVHARRFRCRDCKKTLTERLPDVVEGQRITTRLYEEIGKNSLKKTFTSIAHDVGVSEGTIRSVFRLYVAELEKKYVFDTPEWMGIDELKIVGKLRGVITNLENSTVVELLPERTLAVVQNYFMRLPNRTAIKCVAMDMWKPYRDAVYGCFPNSIIVIDKFHVQRMANVGLDIIRKSIKENLTKKQRRGLMHDRFILLKRANKLQPFEQLTLESWTRNFPALSEAYYAKEEFFNVYECMETDEAKAAIDKWKANLTPSIKEAFKPLVTATGNWETEILNYFEHPVTNAYTECLNGIIRVVDRNGRGYSFEALRAKILFTAGAHKKVTPKFKRAAPVSGHFQRMTLSTYDEPATKNYGTDLSTLLSLIEEEQQ